MTIGVNNFVDKCKTIEHIRRYRMAKTKKTETITVRVSEEQKANLGLIVDARGEGESVILREAVAEYLERHGLHKAPVDPVIASKSSAVPTPQARTRRVRRPAADVPDVRQTG